MPTRKTPIDVSEYLPDEATARAMAQGPIAYNQDVDPKLLARLEELKRMSSNPDLLRPAPASTTEYVPPREVRSAGSEDATLPRAEPKVEVAPPPGPSDYPTQPSLKRLDGEPELPGVVNARSTARSRHVSVRSALLAVLAVVLPVLVVIVLMGRGMQRAEQAGAVSANPAIVPTARASVEPTVAVSASPTAAESATPTPTAGPSATVSAVVPALKPKPRGTWDDPYGAARVPTPPTAPSAKPTAEPSAAPPTNKPTPPPYIEEHPGY